MSSDQYTQPTMKGSSDGKVNHHNKHHSSPPKDALYWVRLATLIILYVFLALAFVYFSLVANGKIKP